MEDISFEAKPFHVKTSRFKVRVFTANSRWRNAEVLMVLKHLTDEQARLKQEAKDRAKAERDRHRSKKKQRRPAGERLKWHDKVDRKRSLIFSMLSRQPNANLVEVSRLTGSAFSTVKRVYHDMMFMGRPSRFVYQNTKSPATLERLSASIAAMDTSFQTVADLRRLHPDCSKRFIRRQLRRTGFRYHLLPKRRKHPKDKSAEQDAVFKAISHIVQAINSQDAKILYLDEVHFPLFQTAERHWTRPDQVDQPVYNRRAVDDRVKLSAIAACSLTQFEAVQVFRHDVTKWDFLYFIQELLSRQSPGQRVTLLADNASWHCSPSVTETNAGEYIFFNVKGFFMTNAIENAFSFVRSDFRKRPTVGTVEEEARLLLDIFFQPQNVDRFKGIFRNHLRSLTKVLLAADPDLASTLEQARR